MAVATSSHSVVCLSRRRCRLGALPLVPSVFVKTAVGMTDRVNIEKIVTQGGTFGPIECANSIDKVGQKSLSEEGDNLFTYKKMVKVPPLGFIDDILSVAKCGLQSLSLNTSINMQIETFLG